VGTRDRAAVTAVGGHGIISFCDGIGFDHHGVVLDYPGIARHVA
jgi:hypothetical protein